MTAKTTRLPTAASRSILPPRKMRLLQVADEIIAVLAADPNAEVKISVEIEGQFPDGASDQTKRAVTENARTLGFKNAEWE